MLATRISIITIGDELLIGQVIDTNSAWIGQRLNQAGYEVRRRMAVGDQWDDIWQALDICGSDSDLVIITGGLGPTADDITKPLLSRYFGGEMVMNASVLEHVTQIFEKKLKRPMIERNRLQAMVPETCTVLHNSRGTAPGMLFEKEKTIYVSLPGVPFEMKGLIDDEVLPILKERFPSEAIIHRTIVTAGVGESFLAERIQDWEASLPTHIKLAYLPHHGMVRLRITGRGKEETALSLELDEKVNALKVALADIMVTDRDEPIEVTVGRLLQTSNLTVGTAESCTGGYIAHLLSKHPGSSKFFKGSIVSYHNAVKESLLHVPHDTLISVGAVSAETVAIMARNAREQLGTDYALAVSGILGPDGGTEEKPVGMVWMAVADADQVHTHELRLHYDRVRNMEQTALQALHYLRRLISKRQKNQG
jgi:nicotinamide-nucleotide amidase